MAPRMPTRQESLDLLGRAAEQAKHAEDYHATAAAAAVLQGRAAHQAACDAAAMQLIELAGCAEGFKLGRGDPNTTLERLEHRLRPFFELRMRYTHPEKNIPPPSIAPQRLSGMIHDMKTAIENLDPDTQRILPPGEMQILRSFAAALIRIEKDRMADPVALRPRDLHYAGYYHEIQFGRLAKATKLYDNWGKSPDPRKVDINSSISDADDMAHKFHTLRRGDTKAILPVSVVAHNHRDRVPGRALSDLIIELRFQLQTPAERQAELQAATITRTREQYRDAVQGLATAYAEVTGDPKAAAMIRDYVQRQESPLDRQEVDTLREALQLAAARDKMYAALPETTHNRFLELCWGLDEQGDSRLVPIFNAAESMRKAYADALLKEGDPRLAATLAMQEAPQEQSDEGEQQQETLQRKRGLSL